MINLKNTRFMQYAAAFNAALCIVAASTYVAWSSPIVPKIAAGDSPLGNRITTTESSWIVSSVLLGTIPGSILSGWTVEKFGRKGSMLIAGIPILLPWFIIAFTSSVFVVCLARFVAGIAISVAISGCLLYNGEIAEKEIRGTIGASFNIAGLTGELFAFSIGPFVSYKVLNLASAAIPFAFVMTFYFMPESPYYLSKIGKYDAAKTNLKRLLKKDITDQEIDCQIDLIKNTVNEEMKNKATFWNFLTKKEYRKSLMISLALQTIQQLTGYVAIASYMQTIITHSKSIVSPEISSILCGCIQLPAVFVAAAMVDRAGRKPLFIISSLGCALALTTEGVYFYLQDATQTDVTYLSWIPTAGILLYLIMRPVGLGTLPFILMGELFATNVKGHAIALSTFYNCLLSFMVAKIFEPVSKVWGIYSMFFLFAAVCVISSFFACFVLPETKGKSLAEIREGLSGKKRDEVVYTSVAKPV